MSADPEEILNWRRWSDKLSLSGQPTEDQFALLLEQRVKHVINLGPHHNKGALPDEASTLATLGMNYIYIPVEFETPTQSNFDLFETAIEQLAGERVHVHCIYNARVSAFMYKYAKVKGAREQDAFDLMDGIWRPGKIWSKLIGLEIPREPTNLFAGYDY